MTSVSSKAQHDKWGFIKKTADKSECINEQPGGWKDQELSQKRNNLKELGVCGLKLRQCLGNILTFFNNQKRKCISLEI